MPIHSATQIVRRIGLGFLSRRDPDVPITKAEQIRREQRDWAYVDDPDDMTRFLAETASFAERCEYLLDNRNEGR